MRLLAPRTTLGGPVLNFIRGRYAALRGAANRPIVGNFSTSLEVPSTMYKTGILGVFPSKTCLQAVSQMAFRRHAVYPPTLAKNCLGGCTYMVEGG